MVRSNQLVLTIALSQLTWSFYSLPSKFIPKQPVSLFSSSNWEDTHHKPFFSFSEIKKKQVTSSSSVN